MLYKAHRITKLKWFSSRTAVVFAQSIDEVAAAPTTSEWSTNNAPRGAAYIRCLRFIYIYIERGGGGRDI